MILKSCLMILNYFFNDLSSSSKKFGSQRNYKGGGGRRPPPPFVVFSATQNCSDWCLNHKKTCQSHQTPFRYPKHNISNSLNSISESLTTYCKIVKQICLDVDKLRIQGRMHFFEQESQSALNHILILQKARYQGELSEYSGISDL